MAVKRSVPSAARLHPKLRMIRNGDGEVNTLRAETSCAVQASAPLAEKHARRRTLDEAPGRRAARATPADTAAPDPSPEIKVSVFLEIDADGAAEEMPPHTARRENLMTGVLSLDELEGMAGRRGVAYVAPGEPLSAPTPTVLAERPAGPSQRRIRSELAAAGGRGVLLGLIDVGGFDFAHPEFLDDEGHTRFHAIWDQGAEPPRNRGEKAPPYGSLLTGEQLDHALAWGREHHVGATDLLRQSSQSPASHGTHVASIAGGRSGVCPHATLAGVLVALSPEESDRRRSFYDSTRLAHAVDFLFGLGRDLGLPTVINLSLGTNGHAHDGSSPICRWIDAALTVPGRCVCVAAGNAGQEAPQFAGDLAQLSGRIHASGRLAASGLETDIEWLVVGNGVVDGSENELEIWYEPQDEFEVRLRSPAGLWTEPVGPGEYIQNQPLGPAEGPTYVSLYNERFHVHNGANRISIFLSPDLKPPIVGVQAGPWIVRLRGRHVRDGRFDAWIERDDPRPLGRVGRPEAWRFPSCFSKRSNVDQSSVNSLASGHRILSVANYEDASERIHPSSSQGPTRDGRDKPEVAAPGSRVVAARGFSSARRPWVAMTGTSMASPYVAGVAALMLAVEPALTASQIIGIMRRTAQPLPGSDYRWQTSAGFGRIRPEACLEEATRAFVQSDVYEQESP
jgi:subtilisin family serine protease